MLESTFFTRKSQSLFKFNVCTYHVVSLQYGLRIETSNLPNAIYVRQYISYNNFSRTRKLTELHLHSIDLDIYRYKKEIILQTNKHTVTNISSCYFSISQFPSVSKLISRAIFRWIPNIRATRTINGITLRIFTFVSFLKSAMRYDPKHAKITENNYLVVASIKWHKKSNAFASISLISRLVVCRHFKFRTSRTKRNFSRRK